VPGTLERDGDLTSGQVPSMDGAEWLLGRGGPWVSHAFCPLLVMGV
jgi:hypothetical protein